jgi:hypothetical protein
MDNQVEEIIEKSINEVCCRIERDMREKIAQQVLKEWDKLEGRVPPLPVYFIQRWNDMIGLN